MDQHDEELICVGHVLGAKGLRGWIRVFSHTSPRDNILNYSPWWIDRGDGLEACEVEGHRQGRHVLARFAGTQDRTAAEKLTGCRLFIRQQQLPCLAAGEYYWADLIGLAVETTQAEPLGRIAAMMETGADDVMVLEGERERLIPFVMHEIVTEVDLGNRRLVVDWSPEY